MKMPTEEEMFTCPGCGQVNNKKSLIAESPEDKVYLPDGTPVGSSLGLVPLQLRAKCKKCKTVFVVDDIRRVY